MFLGRSALGLFIKWLIGELTDISCVISIISEKNYDRFFNGVSMCVRVCVCTAEM